MKGAWIKGSILERAAVRLRHRGRPRNGEALDIFAELHRAAKIIIFPNDRVGGLFLGAPAYKVVREHYPGTAIHLFADPGKADLARQIPFVDEVVTADPTQPAWSAAFSQITASLRRQKFDLALCLGADCSFRRAQICGASGARLRVGFKREGIAPFNIEIIPRPGAGGYEGDQYFSMLRLLGLGGGGEVRWRIAEDQARQVRCRYLHGEFARGNIIGIDLTGGEGQGLTSRQLDDIVRRVVERGLGRFYSSVSRRGKRSPILRIPTATASSPSTSRIWQGLRPCWKVAGPSSRVTPICCTWPSPCRFP